MSLITYHAAPARLGSDEAKFQALQTIIRRNTKVAQHKRSATRKTGEIWVFILLPNV